GLFRNPGHSEGVALDWKRRDDGRRLDARKRVDAVQQRVIKRRAFLDAVIFGIRGKDFQRQQLIRAEADLYAAQTNQATNQQSTADQRGQGQGDLGRD